MGVVEGTFGKADCIMLVSLSLTHMFTWWSYVGAILYNSRKKTACRVGGKEGVSLGVGSKIESDWEKEMSTRWAE